jgi:hypothetical protein
MRLRLGFFFAALLSMTAAAAPRHAKQSIVLAGRLYPSGDFTAVVSAEVRRSDLHVANREGDQATALALAQLQMGSSQVRVDPLEDAGRAPSAPGVVALHYKLAVRPWILPNEETIERALPSVLPGLVAGPLEGPLLVEEVTTIDIDEVYDVTIPDDRLVEKGLGRYRSDYDLTDGRLTVRRTLTLASGRAPLALVRAVDDDVAIKIGIRRLEGPKPAQRADAGRPVLASLIPSSDSVAAMSVSERIPNRERRGGTAARIASICPRARRRR